MNYLSVKLCALASRSPASSPILVMDCQALAALSVERERPTAHRPEATPQARGRRGCGAIGYTMATYLTYGGPWHIGIPTCHRGLGGLVDDGQTVSCTGLALKYFNASREVVDLRHGSNE